MKLMHHTFASTPMPSPGGPWKLVRESGAGEERERVIQQARADVDRVFDEAEVDEILDESFPASDPPPWTLGVDR